MVGRLILNRVDEGSATSASVADQLGAHADVRVLDCGPHSLLVEGELDELEYLGAAVPGWQTVQVRRLPVPDARPRVARTARR